MAQLGRGFAQMTTIQVGQGRKASNLRFFFVGFALFAFAITAIAFVPEYARFAAGNFPIASVLHVHAALMEAWVAAFVLQAWLGATGRVALHRKIGPYAIALGVAAWASMVFVELRTLVAHPLPTELSEYNEILQGVYVYTTFIALLLWALHERRRPPGISASWRSLLSWRFWRPSSAWNGSRKWASEVSGPL